MEVKVEVNKTMRFPTFQNLNGCYTYKKVLFTILILIASVIIFLFSCIFAMGSDLQENKELQLLSNRELSSFLKKIGYPGFNVKASWDISRNPDGTVLRFFNWSKNKVLSVSCKGLINEVDLPGTPTWADRSIWFNDKQHVVAWYEKGSIQFNKEIAEEKVIKSIIKANLPGLYFLKPIYLPTNKDMWDGVAIYSIERPDTLLAKVMKCHGHRIFFKNDKVYLFGSYFNTRDIQKDLYIFQKKNNELELLDKVIIPRPEKSPAPFHVQDFNPWSDEVLFVDVYDLPFRSVWYVYNLNTCEMKKVGKLPYGGGWGFYLQCNIIKNVLEKHR